MQDTVLDLYSDASLIREAKQIIEAGRQSAYQSVNSAMLETYWKLGERIVQQEQQGQSRADYGKQLLATLSRELTATFGKGFSSRNLWYYRQFYVTFPDWEILHTRVQNLTWSHCRALLKISDSAARDWYMNEAATQTWSVRTLERNISSQYYERLLLSPAPSNVKKEMESLTAPFHMDKREFIKNPVVAEFLGLSSNTDFTESDLEQSIISNLQKFLMELGKGYAFVARQQHIRTEETDYFIDLVFYNYILKCFVLIDLKTTKISYQDVGQMDMYLQLYDQYKKGDDDHPTIGIILCSDTNADVARYSTLATNDNLFASKYKLYLPSKEELRREIELQKQLFMREHEDIMGIE